MTKSLVTYAVVFLVCIASAVALRKQYEAKSYEFQYKNKHKDEHLTAQVAAPALALAPAPADRPRDLAATDGSRHGALKYRSDQDADPAGDALAVGVKAGVQVRMAQPRWAALERKRSSSRSRSQSASASQLGSHDEDSGSVVSMVSDGTKDKSGSVDPYAAASQAVRDSNARVTVDLKSAKAASAQRAGPGDRLILTPYIKSGDVAAARQLSLVQQLPGWTESTTMYTGFLTVNETTNSNLFFWFVLSTRSDPEKAPILLWLQGGPGASSLFGLFEEHGPFYMDSNHRLVRRDIAWTNEFNVLYIDNPAGTGFSFTDSPAGYARDETTVGENLLEALQQFFTMFADLRENDFFITGESYGGKYVPAAAYAIYKSGTTKVNLKGIAIGNGLVNPRANTLAYGALLYNVGLLDENELAVFESYAQKTVEYIDAQNWTAAFLYFDMMLNADFWPYGSLFQNATGCQNYFNILQCGAQALADFSVLFADDSFRRAIHVGAQPYSNGSLVEMALLNDVMQPSTGHLTEILDSGLYRVLIYNGNLDIICGAPLTESWLYALNWTHADEYRAAKKNLWRVDSDKDPSGYYRTIENGQLVQLVVRSAGHMVPSDQPRAALDMIKRFASNRF